MVTVATQAQQEAAFRKIARWCRPWAAKTKPTMQRLSSKAWIRQWPSPTRVRSTHTSQAKPTPSTLSKCKHRGWVSQHGREQGGEQYTLTDRQNGRRLSTFTKHLSTEKLQESMSPMTTHFLQSRTTSSISRAVLVAESRRWRLSKTSASNKPPRDQSMPSKEEQACSKLNFTLLVRKKRRTNPSIKTSWKTLNRHNTTHSWLHDRQPTNSITSLICLKRQTERGGCWPRRMISQLRWPRVCRLTGWHRDREWSQNQKLMEVKLKQAKAILEKKAT